MKTRIVVLQTSFSGFMFCREVLNEMGLTEGQDYRLLGDNTFIEKEWNPGQRQLFITGTFNGNERGVAEMVQKARECNPELVCMSFTLNKIVGPFDHHIAKLSGDSSERLSVAVKGFLEGTVNRIDATRTPSTPK